MFDLDDFKRVNDVHGHGAGDAILVQIARLAREAIRASDIVCRIGGEEFAAILPSCDAGDALAVADRMVEELRAVELDAAGHMTLSLGIAEGPRHAMNPRELVACAEAAMMTAKARGKNRCVVYDQGGSIERPTEAEARDLRSIAHLKMLQSLAGKLNRLNDVRQIGETIAAELRHLIDYHNCRVLLRDGDQLRPITFLGDHDSTIDSATDAYSTPVGIGITGRVAETGRSLLVPNALECEFAFTIPGTEEIEESLAAVPLYHGSRVTGVIVISKLGVNQFDGDDVRLLEVLAGQASVALENARLLEQQRREAEAAKALLRFADRISLAASEEEICAQTVAAAADLFDAEQASVWLGGRSAASIGEPLRDGVSAPLSEGEVDGRLVVGVEQLDEERARILASLARHVSAALERARLYLKQREAAEIAGALLEASREFATAESPEEVLRRSVEVTARALGTGRAVLWIQEDSGARELVARAAWGHASEPDPVGRLRIDAGTAHGLLGEREPFVLEAEEVEELGGALGESPGRIVVAPLRLEGNRVGALTSSVGSIEIDERQLRLLAGLADQAKLAIESAEHFERLERTFVSTVASLANALEASDQDTSSHGRWISDMSLLVGRELGLDPDALEAARAGSALPRHRQDRHPLRHPPQARPAHRRGVRGRQGASGARGADPRPHRPPGRGPADRARLPRTLGRSRLPGRPGGKLDPGRVAHRARVRRVPRDGHRSPVSPAPLAGGGDPAPARGGRVAVRPACRRDVRPPLRGRAGAAATGFLTGILEAADGADLLEAEPLQDGVGRVGERLGDEARRPAGDRVLPAGAHERAVDAAAARLGQHRAGDQEDAAVREHRASEAHRASVELGEERQRAARGPVRLELASQVRPLLLAPLRRRLEGLPHHLVRHDVVLDRLDEPDRDVGRARCGLAGEGERVQVRAAVARLDEAELVQPLLEVGRLRSRVEPPRRQLLRRDALAHLGDERLDLVGADTDAGDARPDRALDHADALVGEPVDVGRDPRVAVGALRELAQRRG